MNMVWRKVNGYMDLRNLAGSPRFPFCGGDRWMRGISDAGAGSVRFVISNRNGGFWVMVRPRGARRRCPHAGPGRTEAVSGPP